MPGIKTRDLHIYFESQGEGDPVLFINGTDGYCEQLPTISEGWDRLKNLTDPIQCPTMATMLRTCLITTSRHCCRNWTTKC
jgi:hypothetical protein